MNRPEQHKRYKADCKAHIMNLTFDQWLDGESLTKWKAFKEAHK